MATGLRGTRARVATVLSLRWPATSIELRLTPLAPQATHGPAVLLHEGQWRYPDGRVFLRLWRSGRGLRADCARLGRFVVSPHGQHVGYRRDPAAAPAACEAYFFSALIALPQWLHLAPRTAAQLGLVAARRRGYDAAGGKTLIGARRWASRTRPARAVVVVLERELSADPLRAGAAPALERLRGHAAWAVLALHSLVAPLLRPLGRGGATR